MGKKRTGPPRFNIKSDASWQRALRCETELENRAFAIAKELGLSQLRDFYFNSAVGQCVILVELWFLLYYADRVSRSSFVKSFPANEQLLELLPKVIKLCRFAMVRMVKWDIESLWQFNAALDQCEQEIRSRDNERKAD